MDSIRQKALKARVESLNKGVDSILKAIYRPDTSASLLQPDGWYDYAVLGTTQEEFFKVSRKVSSMLDGVTPLTEKSIKQAETKMQKFEQALWKNGSVETRGKYLEAR